MPALLSGVILIASFGLLAALGLVLVVALFRVTGSPAANSSRGSQSGE